MKLVVDTNILFGYFWENSVTHELLSTSTSGLISPQIALKELNKYSKEIMNKLNLSKIEFKKKLDSLKKIVSFINMSEYKEYMNKAEKISPDKDDVEFFAVCIKFSCILWSNDKLLKNQEEIVVLNTEELIKLL